MNEIAPEAPADEVSSLEEQILNGDSDGARAIFRKMLLQATGLGSGSTIGEALAELTKNATPHRREAVLVLRCLTVQGLMPDANSTNQIVRSVVSLCESSLPDVLDFLRIEKRQQNIEKYLSLSAFHSRIEEILAPIRAPYGDLNALLNARKEMIGALNHSIVRQYASPFLLKETRATIETIFGHLKRVSEVTPSLLIDIDECNQSIARAQFELNASPTFLSHEFLGPFLLTCAKVISDFLTTLRGRFATTISVLTSQGELQKRYPLHEPEREIQVAVPLRNAGPGLATDLQVSVTAIGESVVVQGGLIKLGNVLPGDFSVAIDSMVISPSESFSFLANVEWGEIGNPSRRSELMEIKVVAQDASIDWHSLLYESPYTIGPAEGDQFLGRKETVAVLSARLLRQPMEPFYITGQKRVGKTSLALAIANFAKANAKQFVLDYHYILWGNIAHADPGMSLQSLGESIEQFICDSMPEHVTPGATDYRGSLSNLIRLATLALTVKPERRYVVILDEFDEIHQELFLQGNLAETFFANLRALSRCKNICIVLIGGENMPFVMDRQGQKLNNFSRVSLNYFSRTDEWDDFQLIVKQPTSGTLHWHEDAVSEVFNTTNGNPYFAKSVCAQVMRQAVSERDADITANEVSRAIEKEVSTFGAHSFAHIWQDGVPKPAAEREPDILRRMRVLVSLARCVRLGVKTTLENILANKTSESLLDAEIPVVLNDFVRREILRERDRLYSFSLPVFGLWLVNVGISQLFADSLNEELANFVLTRENASNVRSEEVVELSRNWPTYRGRHIGTDDIRTWYQQVDSLRDQRLLFELLKRTKVFSEALVRERLKNAHGFVRPILPEFIIRTKGARRRDVLLTFIDNEGKSGASYASTYAEENNIASECVLSRTDFIERFERHSIEHGTPAALVIIDDIAATGRSLARNIEGFIKDTRHMLENTKVRIITLVATEMAQSKMVTSIAQMTDLDIEFRSCEILGPEQFAFPTDGSVWPSNEDEARAKALCVDLGSHIYPRDPLGYGGLGILVVFPTTAPNNSLPILHSYSRTSSHRKWEPLFPRVSN
ncbi:hypothetical protein SAMN05443247_08707 [Bradyrhizobium erythrophlei]|nr:hypothetical protein SAMN05443247_08707 [Bradyrhizobium erythrophlei]